MKLANLYINIILILVNHQIIFHRIISVLIFSVFSLNANDVLIISCESNETENTSNSEAILTISAESSNLPKPKPKSSFFDKFGAELWSLSIAFLNTFKLDFSDDPGGSTSASSSWDVRNFGGFDFSNFGGYGFDANGDFFAKPLHERLKPTDESSNSYCAPSDALLSPLSSLVPSPEATPLPSPKSGTPPLAQFFASATAATPFSSPSTTPKLHEFFESTTSNSSVYSNFDYPKKEYDAPTIAALGPKTDGFSFIDFTESKSVAKPKIRVFSWYKFITSDTGFLYSFSSIILVGSLVSKFSLYTLGSLAPQVVPALIPVLVSIT